MTKWCHGRNQHHHIDLTLFWARSLYFTSWASTLDLNEQTNSNKTNKQIKKPKQARNQPTNPKQTNTQAKTSLYFTYVLTRTSICSRMQVLLMAKVVPVPPWPSPHRWSLNFSLLLNFTSPQIMSVLSVCVAVNYFSGQSIFTCMVHRGKESFLLFLWTCTALLPSRVRGQNWLMIWILSVFAL